MHSHIAKPPRFGFLDLYRGIIVLFMLEGHVLREVLLPELRTSAAFTFHELFHGITAPGFLFGAGFAFAIATQRKWEESVRWNKQLARRIGRLLFLIAIGYVLHFPYLSLQKTIETATPLQWQQLFGFDALQCIALTLLLLRLLFFTFRNESAFLWTTGTLLVATVYATPFLWQSSLADSLPLFVSAALNGLRGSIFPLFPYAGFVFAGVLVSWLFLRAANRGNDDVWMKGIAVTGFLLVVLGFLAELIPFTIYPPYDYWSASPNYFWTKLGFLLLLLSALWFFEETLLAGTKPFEFMPKWITTLGVESLFVYIVHLIVLYGWLINPGFSIRAFWSGGLGLGGSIVLFVLLAILCAFVALGWRHLKKHHPVLMRGIYWWMGLCVGYSVLFNPY